MGNTTNGNTPADDLVSASVRIGDITEQNRKTVHQHLERLADSSGFLGTQAQRSRCLLGTTSWSTVSVTASRQFPINEVGYDRCRTVVGTSFAELDKAENVGGHWEASRDPTKGGKLLIRWFPIVVLVGKSLGDGVVLRVGVNHSSRLVNRQVGFGADGILRIGGLCFR